MKNKIKKFVLLICIISCFSALNPAYLFSDTLIDETKLLTVDSLKFVKPPADFRNYFFFQSIDDTSVILIGDFVGPEKIITLVIDENSDNTIDSITEFFPESQKFKTKKKLSSNKFSNDIKTLKKEIIEGTVFEKNYSYDMSTLKTVKNKLENGTDIYNYEAGWSVINYDPENAKSPMNQFYFKLKEGRYDLIFKTNYYKLYHTIIYPPISYAVYCRNSKDPVVAKYVEELLQLLPDKASIKSN